MLKLGSDQYTYIAKKWNMMSWHMHYISLCMVCNMVLQTFGLQLATFLYILFYMNFRLRQLGPGDLLFSLTINVHFKQSLNINLLLLQLNCKYHSTCWDNTSSLKFDTSNDLPYGCAVAEFQLWRTYSLVWYVIGINMCLVTVWLVFVLDEEGGYGGSLCVS